MGDTQSIRYPRFLQIVCLLLALFLTVTSLALGTAATPAPQQVSILFSHDMHSHFDAELREVDGKTEGHGGFAKLKTAADSVRQDYPNTLLMDAGDFAMGTPFQTIFSSHAAELRMLGELGYDAVTLGNHEFDYRTVGLTDMLHAAQQSGDPLPPMFFSNIDWERTLADPQREGDASDLRQAMEQVGVEEDFGYLTAGDVTVAVFGLLGIQADEYAPESGLYFLDPIERSKEIVAAIEAEGKADLIVCLSHSGTDDDPKKSEDELLAKAVPQLDLIVSGHTHTRLDQPLIHGDTVIASCGNYTDNLGHVVLEEKGDRWTVKEYRLIPLDDNVPENTDIIKTTEDFRQVVSSSYFSRFGYTYDQVLAVSPFAFTDINTFGKQQGEDGLGNLISDSYIYAVKKAEGPDSISVDVAVAPEGVIRGSFGQGPITVADCFNVSSLGIGPDRVPGYPLVSIYLTGAELKTLAEIDISVSTLMAPARLYVSGMGYSYNPSRLLLNRVTDVWMDTADGPEEIQDDRLYRVVGGLYSTQMIGAVESQSSGLLSVIPKDAEGQPIENFEEHIIYADGKELKEWQALATYLESLDTKDGMPVVPAYYNTLHGRKVLEDDNSLSARLKNPNKITFLVGGVLLLALVVMLLVILLVRKLIRRRKKKRA